MDIGDGLSQSGFQTALNLEHRLPRRASGAALIFFGFLGLFSLLATSLSLANPSAAYKFLGLTEIFLSLFFLVLLYFFYTGFAQAKPELSLESVKQAFERGEFGWCLTFPAAELLTKSCQADKVLVKVFLQNLLSDHRFLWMLRRWNIDPKFFAKAASENYSREQTILLGELLGLALNKALLNNHLEIRVADLIAALYELDKTFEGILANLEIQAEDVVEVVYWQRRREESHIRRGRFWDKENLMNIKGIGKDWSGGFTVNLDRACHDLTRGARLHRVPTHLYGRGQQVDLLERMLVRGAGSSNAVLVGLPGVGRHTVLESFAARVNSGQTLGPLRYSRILEIESSSILSGSASLNDVIAKIQILFGEAYRAANVILVIDNLDAFFDPHPEAGRVNATEALLPFFQSSLRIIGTTTPLGYQSTIGKNMQLARLIAKLEIGELSEAHTLLILEDIVPGIEKQSGLFFTHAALKEIVKLATKLIQDLPNPEKSIQVLEETAVYVATGTSDAIVIREHVQKVVSTRTKVPVGKVAGEEAATLMNLETLLHQRIIGQDEALRQLASALRRSRSGVTSGKKPIGSFLFLGPTGVGKTETTKALAAVYFGSEKNMVRFDMSEYQEIHSINRLIGDPDKNTGGLLTESVVANPFCLVLLDELEKAHPKVMDLFLQVFDEGRLTDAQGRTVNFTNAMFVATSNAGAEQIRQMVKDGIDPLERREEIIDELQEHGIFLPEFLNRFDAVIIFKPLSVEELTEVAALILNDLNTRLAEKRVQVRITPELARAVAAASYSPEFGARPLRRFIQENVENYVAQGLLSGTIQGGQTVELDPANFLRQI